MTCLCPVTANMYKYLIASQVIIKHQIIKNGKAHKADEIENSEVLLKDVVFKKKLLKYLIYYDNRWSILDPLWEE